MSGLAGVMGVINRLSVGQKVMSLIVVELLSFSLLTANAITQIKTVGAEVEKMSSIYMPAFSSVQSIREQVLGQKLYFQGVINVGETVVYDEDARLEYQRYRRQYEEAYRAIAQIVEYGRPPRQPQARGG